MVGFIVEFGEVIGDRPLTKIKFNEKKLYASFSLCD
jgi:hypothetical protein